MNLHLWQPPTTRWRDENTEVGLFYCHFAAISKNLDATTPRSIQCKIQSKIITTNYKLSKTHAQCQFYASKISKAQGTSTPLSSNHCLSSSNITNSKQYSCRSSTQTSSKHMAFCKSRPLQLFFGIVQKSLFKLTSNSWGSIYNINIPIGTFTYTINNHQHTNSLTMELLPLPQRNPFRHTDFDILFSVLVNTHTQK